MRFWFQHSTDLSFLFPVFSIYLLLINSRDRPNWHARLGHPNDHFRSLMLKALPFTSKFMKVFKVLKAFHMDLVGPFSVQSPAGCSQGMGDLKWKA
ncbi:hypothetical protein VP01_2453g1 [Puccinia sorghi]|uniref:Uncharacterized protein n=1 Tax=Puccinia sorghi TaxID=27349 RepID=A0A0L6V626_9BASI|nr:hypothetical protein VP01_2453g1 [Puccinia sorghi]